MKELIDFLNKQVNKTIKITQEIFFFGIVKQLYDNIPHNWFSLIAFL